MDAPSLNELRKKYMNDMIVFAGKTSEAALKYARVAKEAGDPMAVIQYNALTGPVRKRPRDRDPSMPRKPGNKTAYMMFKQAVKASMGNNEVSTKGFAKRAKDSWDALGPEARKPFEISAKEYMEARDAKSKAAAKENAPPVAPEADKAWLERKTKAIIAATATQILQSPTSLKVASPHIKAAAAVQGSGDDETESEEEGDTEDDNSESKQDESESGSTESESAEDGSESESQGAEDDSEDSFDIRQVTQPHKSQHGLENNFDELAHSP